MTEQTARLSLTLRHPASAFLYRATSPRVRVDGVDAEIQGWGTHTIAVEAGRHRVEVWVPYTLPRRAGRAHAVVSVGPGERVRLEYMAPTLTFAHGSLGAPGQQRSAGLRPVAVLNVVVVVALLVAGIAIILAN